MTCCTNEYSVCLEPDATNTIQMRLSATNGSGSETGEPGRGNWLQQADFSAIYLWVYDLDAADPDAAIYDGAVTVADVIVDTPVTGTQGIDEYGHNFIHNWLPAWVPTAGHRYRGKYLFTLTDGTTSRVFVRGTALGNPGDED